VIPSWSINDESAIEEIEARFRALNRRLYDLESAIEASQEMLKVEPENFAFGVAAQSLLTMHRSLQSEKMELCRYRANENIVLVLDGAGIDHHSASALSLSVVLNRVQRLFSSIAQSITSGPTLRGPLSTSINDLTGLRVAATFPSSFGLNLYVPSNYDLHGNSVSSSALDVLFQLLGAATSDETMMGVTGEVGTRSMRHLNALAKHLEQSELEVSIAWKDVSGVQRGWSVNPEGAAAIASKIEKVSQTKASKIEVNGRLVGASLVKDRFEIQADGTIYYGKFVRGLGEQVREFFGSNVSAQIEETVIRDTASQTSKSYFTLIELRSKT
jgi:hypothetical protein